MIIFDADLFVAKQRVVHRIRTLVNNWKSIAEKRDRVRFLEPRAFEDLESALTQVERALANLMATLAVLGIHMHEGVEMLRRSCTFESSEPDADYALVMVESFESWVISHTQLTQGIIDGLGNGTSRR